MKLVICNTYSQLIIAIQLKLTLFKSENIDIWISDHSSNSELIINPLISIGLFHEVKYFEEKKFAYARKPRFWFYDVIKSSYGRTEDLDIAMYDEIIFYSLSFLLYDIADYYKKNNYIAVWSKMEEGIFSYETDFESGRRLKAARFFRRLNGRYEIANNIKNYYCFFPELKESHQNWNFYKIPSISETRTLITAILKHIFSFEEFDFKQKYLFFASSSDIDNEPFGETELILRVAQKVGAENLIVKMHPRDTRSIYKDKGIAVMNNSWVPWEVMQLAENLENKYFLTVNSGAFITVSALLGGEGKGMFLYPSVKDKTVAFLQRESTIRQVLNKLHTNHLCEGIKEGTIEEILVNAEGPLLELQKGT